MPVNRDRIAKDFETINSFNATPGQGITRLTFSPEYMGAYGYVRDELAKIGAEITVHRAGCLTGRLLGASPELPVVMFGSHLDTVKSGGRFDGVAGVVAALEAARALREEGASYRHGVQVVVFPEEEGSRFGTVLAGSRYWAGSLGEDDFARLTDGDGLTFRQAMDRASLAPENQALLDPAGLKAMLELHIEQSVVLEKQGRSIAVVGAIAGIKSFLITINGEANHAGGTPMRYRRDSLQAAVRAIAMVEDIAAQKAGPTTVATVGSIACQPGMSNVIPGVTEFTLDIRDTDQAVLDSAVAQCLQAVESLCRERGLEYQVRPRSDTPPIQLDQAISRIMEEKISQAGHQPTRMISGALHDSSAVAELAPTGMLFVPSKKGRSHCPEEDTDLADIVLGSQVLLETVKELAN